MHRNARLGKILTLVLSSVTAIPSALFLLFLALIAVAPSAAQTAFVRVNQVGLNQVGSSQVGPA